MLNKNVKQDLKHGGHNRKDYLLRLHAAKKIALNNGDVMVNATQMAKPFGKKANDFLKTQSTKDFLSVLSASKNIEATILVSTINGGKNFGTWMHEGVALEFARWLSPAILS